MRRVRQSVLSFSLRYFDVSGRPGMKSAVQIARTNEGTPSMRKRILHWAIALVWIDETPNEMRPPKAPESAPAEMNRPTRLARSCLVYQSERWKAMACPKNASPTPTNRRHTNRPARLNVAAWHVAAMDQMRAPAAIEYDGLICLAMSVPGICKSSVSEGERQASSSSTGSSQSHARSCVGGDGPLTEKTM